MYGQQDKRCKKFYAFFLQENLKYLQRKMYQQITLFKYYFKACKRKVRTMKACTWKYMNFLSYLPGWELLQ